MSYALTELGQELTVPVQDLLGWITTRALDVVRAQRQHDKRYKPAD
ncbi:hypothetical protein [Dactylosporangium sp. CA-233914]